MTDLQSFSTPELKTLIRRQDDMQEEAVLELCTRHDAGDLVAFFKTLKFQPADTNEFLVKTKKLNISSPVAAAATGLTPGAVRNRIMREERKSGKRPAPDKSGSVTPVTRSDKTDTSEQPAGSNIVRLDSKRPRQKYESSCGLGIDTRANGEQYSYQRIVIPGVLSGRLFATKEGIERDGAQLAATLTAKQVDTIFDLIELLQTVYRKVIR